MESYLTVKELQKWNLLDDVNKAKVVKYGLTTCYDQLVAADIKSIDVKSVYKGSFAEDEVMKSIKYDVSKCSSKPNSTDLRVVNKGKVIYIEVKNYTSAVPQKELAKFLNDIESKGDIFGGLFLGWNESKFYYHKGLPILLMKGYDLVNEGLELLFSLEPKKNIDKVLESVDEVVSILNIIDNMTTNFMKNRDELKARIIIFRERCSKYTLEIESNDLTKVIKPDMHASKELIYNFIKRITKDGFKSRGKELQFTYNNKTIILELLKTRSRITIPHILGLDEITLDLSELNLDGISSLLEN